MGDKQFGKHPQVNVITKKPDAVQVEKYVKNHHEGIISRDLWEAVQARLERGKDEQARKKRERRRILAILLSNPEIKRKQIVERTALPAETVGKHLVYLRRYGIIRKEGKVWTVDSEQMRKKYEEE